MKHHKHAQGWRECNELTTREFIRELVLLACSYLGAIGFILIAVKLFTR